MLNKFRTLIYPSSGACDCVVELPHRSSCSQFVVCWRFGAAGFELVFHSSTITMMHGPINIKIYVNYHQLVFYWTSFIYKMNLVYFNAFSAKVT